MNKQRRKALEALRDKLEEMQAAIADARDAEQLYLDAMPESLKESAKARVAEAAIEALDDTVMGLDDACHSLTDAFTTYE